MESPPDHDNSQKVELERFDDFTVASSWERFISAIEAVLRQCLADGPQNLLEKGAICSTFSRNLYEAKFDLKHAKKNYSIVYYFPTHGHGEDADWTCDLHDMQLSFGVNDFLVIAPQSASGVVLDAPEASKLLSAVAIASTNCSCPWPAFVPIHDPSRKAYIGIQNTDTMLTRRFESDRIGSQVPVRLMHLEGLYELFVSKFAFSMFSISRNCMKVHFAMKLTYRTLPNDEIDEIEDDRTEISGYSDAVEMNIRNNSQWDDDCPWSEWYSTEDPVKGFDLIATWSEKLVECSVEMDELENSSPHEAEKWILLPNFSLNQDVSAIVGFASQLRLLLDALNASYDARFVEDFLSDENKNTDLRTSPSLPPPTVLDREMKVLFCEESQFSGFPEHEHQSSWKVKGALLESLFAQFCLHALWFGNCNIRAISLLWIEFVREVRWCWEECQPLPRMAANGAIDLSTCLINQKLHMLAICIEKKRLINVGCPEFTESDDGTVQHGLAENCPSPTQSPLKDSQDVKGEARWDGKGETSRSLVQDVLHKSKTTESSSGGGPDHIMHNEPSENARRGSSGPVVSMMLLNSYQKMHAPFTQDAPPMTEDMHEERLQAVEALGHSLNFSAHLERDVLSSDMSAFKAANPKAIFEDFIRWHSPGDWEDDHFQVDVELRRHEFDALEDDWPPRGRLSHRMSGRCNLWRKIWNDVPALPASEQKALMDPNREGEKVLHYLETVRPHQLLEQMVCTAFRASANTLHKTSYGELTLMSTKLDQLYATMASVLKILQAKSLSQKCENVGDVMRLCDIFEHVEKLLILAASLHRKFLKVPRISKAIFGRFYMFYLPMMGTSSTNDVPKEFECKEPINIDERQAVEMLFTPPNTNQSWRRILTMGNLLNGHEPVLREIIFSKRDLPANGHYAAIKELLPIDMYRMYIRGTSNDLHVALSVVSSD